MRNKSGLRPDAALRLDRLRLVREQHGWSQRELGRLCGMGEAQIGKYENGENEPTATKLKLIAEQLDVSIDYLLGTTDDPRPALSRNELNPLERDVLNTYRRDGWLGLIRMSTDQLAKDMADAKVAG